MLKSNLKHSKKFKKSILTSIQKDVEKKWSTERQTRTMEQPIPPFSEDGFSEPAQRLWGNPTPQESTVSPAIALLIGKDEGINPAASKSLHMNVPGAGHLPCSQVSRKRDQQALQPNATVPHQPKSLLRRGLGEMLAPSARSQLSSSGMGLKHTGLIDRRGFTLPCCCHGVSCSQYVPKVSFQLPKGEMEEIGETPGHWEQPGSTHPSPQLQP